MKPIFRPSGVLGWPHLQRLVERGLRRWGYAFAGFALGLSGMQLAQPEVGEAYASALQAQTRSVQQWVDTASTAPAQVPEKVASTTGQAVAQAKRLLSQLPVSTRSETLWTTWQQILAANDLRLQFLQPVPSVIIEGRGNALVSHAAAWRVLGRFEDWARVWEACAESGPVCAIERISVVASNQPGDVQIDAVMRVWMRSAEEKPTHESMLSDWMADAQKGARSSTRLRTALFVPSHPTEGETNTRQGDGLASPTRKVDVSVAEARPTDLPNDPNQWPLARIRLAGLWQQGGDRQAVLSAGTHAVRVMLGQRVSLEGHRVVAISDQGVHLRLGKEPSFQLPWAEVVQVGGSAPLSAGLSASPRTESSNSGSTTGSQAR
jgi:Tfp pilus assembly protein PilP